MRWEMGRVRAQPDLVLPPIPPLDCIPTHRQRGPSWLHLLPPVPGCHKIHGWAPCQGAMWGLWAVFWDLVGGWHFLRERALTPASILLLPQVWF